MLEVRVGPRRGGRRRGKAPLSRDAPRLLDVGQVAVARALRQVVGGLPVRGALADVVQINEALRAAEIG